MSQRHGTSLSSIEGLLYDFRLAMRGLWRDRGFASAALATLALAIGLNASAFTVMQAMLFRGYPLVKDNQRLVYLQERTPARVGGISYADFEDWRAQAHSFEGLAFIGENRVRFREGSGRPSDQSTFLVSTNLFKLLGVAPMLGRDFVPADEAPGAPPVVILNYRFWANQLGKRPDVVGSRIEVDGAPATIIAVMPERFDFPTQWNLWMPAIHSTERGITPGGYQAVGRLRPSVSASEARAELEIINRRVEAAYPATNRSLSPILSDNLHYHAGPNGPMVYGTLWAAACFVLFIACANLTNLTLVRTIGRWRDFETRLALGAGPARMIRHVLMEGMGLASTAGAIGWWITSWAIRSWAAATASPYQILDYQVDTGTMLYLAVISVAAAILFSLAPIAKLARLCAGDRFSRGVRGASQGPGSRRLSNLLVAGQMALAIVLLSGAGVLVRSFVKLVTAETGVREPDQILTGMLELPSEKYAADAPARLRLFDRLETQLKNLPGVQSAALANRLPALGMSLQPFEIEDRPSPPPGSETSTPFVAAGPDYFRVLGAGALAGREFNEFDRAGSPPVALVNQSFAQRFFPGEQPLGKRIRVKTRNQARAWRTVVGVVSNIMQADATRQNFKPLVYVPIRQAPPTGAVIFLVLTGADRDSVARSVPAEIQRLDSDLLLRDFRTLKASFAFDGDNMDVEHMELGKDAAVAPVFALMALLLAAIGLYAVIARSVSQRRKEIGVRMAIGATAWNIRRMILQDGMAPVIAGMLLGLAAALALNRVLQSLLVAVSPGDPVTMTIAGLGLILVALFACQMPAQQATKVDPAITLREE